MPERDKGEQPAPSAWPPWLRYTLVLIVALVWAANMIADILGAYEVKPIIHGLFFGALWTVTGIRLHRILNGNNRR